jgi:hypothetical protein
MIEVSQASMLSTTDLANRGNNFIATAALRLAGLGFGAVIFEHQEELIDKVDNAKLPLIGVAAIAGTWQVKTATLDQ